jgi:hypothetical protein
MFKDLFIAIASGVIGVMPVQAAPAVVVTATDIESSVVKYIENHEDRTVTIDCNFNFSEIAIEEEKSQSFTCVTIDEANSEKFNTVIILSAIDAKVNITAVVGKADTSVPSEVPEIPEKE